MWHLRENIWRFQCQAVIYNRLVTYRVCTSRSSLSFPSGITDVECIKIRRPIYILLFISRKSERFVLMRNLLFYAFLIFLSAELDIWHLIYICTHNKRYFAYNIKLNAILMANRHAFEKYTKTHSHEATESRDETYMPYCIGNRF